MAKKLSGYSFLTLAFLLASTSVFAQTNAPVAMADTMRSEGKIYVVVAVIITIFIGLIIYLISLDRKITKLEQESDNG
jgi:hypothetical protein